MEKRSTSPTVANVRNIYRRRLRLQFLRSMSPRQREMFAAINAPISNRRVERALARLIESLAAPGA